MKAPRGVNDSDVCNRVRSFPEEARSKKYRKIAVVSHICAIRCLMKEALKLSEEETLKIRISACDPISIEI